MSIKNYTTKVPTAQSVAEIIGSIAEHGASAIQQTSELSFAYDNNSGKYAASIATPMTAIAGDDVFDFVDAAKTPRETQCLLVYLKSKPKAGAYKAERCDCAVKRVSYRECGTMVDFTIILGDATERGIFDTATKQFTLN